MTVTTDAESFHSLARDDLARLEFFPVNDPSCTRGRFSDSSADYECARGLHLSVGFENDSCSALVMFGRQWSVSRDLVFLSNHYAVLAKRLGLTTPMSYPLSWGEQRASQLAAILQDLNRTLPQVLTRVSLDDVIEIEREDFGAETKARHFLGSEHLDRVNISSIRPV